MIGRSRVRRRALVACAIAAALSGCEPRDSSDEAVSRAAQPRLLSLAPHLTELTFAAGAGNLLVGAVAFSDYPPEARAIPRVGDAFRLDYEAIADLRPDIVLAWPSGNSTLAIEQLQALGYRVVELEPRGLDSIPEQLLTIGRIAGTSAVARAAAADFREALGQLRARYAGARRVRVFFQVSGQPLITVSRAHVIGQAIELCGGENVFAGLPGLTPTVDPEAVVASGPEVIVTTVYDGPARGAEALESWRDWTAVPAVRAEQLYVVEADYLSRAGPRILLGVRALCERIDAARAVTLSAAGAPR